MTPNRKHWRTLVKMSLFIVVLSAAVLIIADLRKGYSVSYGDTAYAAGTEPSGTLRALFEAPQWLSAEPLRAAVPRGARRGLRKARLSAVAAQYTNGARMIRTRASASMGAGIPAPRSGAYRETDA